MIAFTGRSRWGMRWTLVLTTAVAAVSPSASAFAQELPRVFLDTTHAPPPVPPGQLISVANGGDFQAALNQAQLGDIIELQAGSTFTGNFLLPAKTGTGWIYIRSSAHANLPSPGTRVFPSHASLMPKIRTTNSAPALITALAAHHYRFVGVEIMSTASLTYNVIWLEGTVGGNSQQNDLTDVPSDIVFDRCYIHGNPTGNVRRGIAMNSARTAVIDSYISEIHEVGQEAQAIGGSNGPGPYKIVNNYLEGAGENIMFGGSDPMIPNLVPEDIEIRRNHFFKPLSWKQGHPSYAGFAWTIKNLFELKNARRVLVEGNILENNWLHAQTGTAVLFTVRNQDGGCPWCTVEDVTFQKNIVRHTTAGISILGTDYNHTSRQTARILIRDNLLYDVDSQRWGTGCCNRDLFLNNSNSPDPLIGGGIKDLIIEHNTTRVSGGSTAAVGIGDDTAPDNRHVNPIFRNNLFQRGDFGIFSSAGEGTAALNTYTTGWTFAANAIIGAPASLYPPQSCAPASTCFPATDNDVRFVNVSADDYRLCATGTPGCAGPSPYKNAGTDGKDTGADMDALQLATAGSISGSWPSSGGQSPYNGTPFSAPSLFEAEYFDLGGEGVAYHDLVPGNTGGAFRTSEDVDVVLAHGNGNGYVVNSIQTGEWIEYSINAGTTGAYTIELRVSSEYNTSRFHLEIDGVAVSGSMPVPNTGWWGTFQFVPFSGVNLSAGQHVLRVHSDEEYFNLDAIRITTQSPFTGTPFAVPGLFEAENFDRGGEGVAYHDMVPGNAGGQYRTSEDVDIIPAFGNASGYIVNNIQTGEWLEYTINVATAGPRTIELKVSSEYIASRFHIEVDGVDVSGPIVVPNTGWWGTFQFVSGGSVNLGPGHHVLRVHSEEEYFNLDAIRVN